ncbi:acetylserotonin O-methyltransferase-like [Malania oleifera]|uniref:acetylserotonin O-methyltransferase-like n=1 Tax=Malania oleifera TaxID=397392 RepID=UPI0025AE823B|nr:acetylserotonin O-methyltransferase-like [Malania oleifera]
MAETKTKEMRAKTEENRAKTEKMRAEEEEEAQAEVDIWNYVFGFVEMAVVKCAIELGIADVLETHQNPMTLSELSRALGCAPSSLHRIMRFLVHRRVFKAEHARDWEATRYAQTALSRRFMRQGEKSMADIVLLESSPPMLAPWHFLSARVLTQGENLHPFEAALGEDVWGYSAVHPAHSKLINDAMACDARIVIPALIEGCPEVFDGVGTLVDVGGGNGVSLCKLVKALPWIRGINFDLPHVVATAAVCEGVQNVGGNMFDAIPKADAAFIQWVLHDWGDEECIQVLKNCRESIPQDGGKVIILEAVVGEEREEKLKGVSLMLDMVMMAHTFKGKERTLKEWVYVLREAGFSRHAIKHIRAVQSVIVAYP